MIRKTILNESKVSWAYPKLYNCNIYDGCAHDCVYCYYKLKMQKYRPSKIWKNAERVDNAVELINAKKNKIDEGVVMFCSTCDAYQNPKDLDFVRACLEALLDSPHRILILTKSHLVMQHYDLISKYENVEVGFTFTSLNKTGWERNAPSPEERIVALKETTAYGPHGITGYDTPFPIKAFVSIEPIIPYTTDPIKIMQELSWTVDRWILGSLNHMQVPNSYYLARLPLWMKFLTKNRVRFYLKPELSRLLPSGYPDRHGGMIK